MTNRKLKEAVHRYLEEQEEPTTIHQICDEFARRQGCMSATGMGRMMRSDGRFEKVDGGWTLRSGRRGIKPIWFASLIVNLIGIADNVYFGVSSKSIFVFNISLAILCLYMVTRRNKKEKEQVYV